MSGRSIGKHFVVFAFLVVLIFAPADLSGFLRNPFVDAGDYVIVENHQSWSGMKTLSGYASVEPGATLTIEKGTIIELESGTFFAVSGNLFIEGTPEAPVVFRKKSGGSDEGYSVSISGSGRVSARNMDVSGGGSVMNAYLVRSGRNLSLVRYADAGTMYAGAFEARSGGTFDIEGANLHDNALAVYADRSSGGRVKVWRSRFSRNDIDFVGDSAAASADMRYDWWGSGNGPEACVSECGYHPRPYQKIIGNADVSDFAEKADFKDPLIVIPGILGSWRWTHSSDLVLDPITGTYDNLVEALKENGYAEGEALFLFPYEWRESNVETAKLLKAKISEIQARAKWPKVDIVAHSMGGLVAREYVETLDGGNTIDQLITLGTPHNGSPEDYLTWEGGEIYEPSFIRGVIAKNIFRQEAQENGYDSIFDYIRKVPLSSVRELLPIYPYLRGKTSGDLRSYPDDTPTNPFLENLKAAGNMEKLKGISFTNIIGEKGSDTISTLRVNSASIALMGDDEAIVKWGHGELDGYDALLGGDRGLELGSGDGTVPIASAEDIPADETITLESSHGDLPTNAENTVYRILTGSDTIKETLSKTQPSALLMVQAFSPIDMQVVSPSGKRVGKNFETDGLCDEIPGAYYTGFDTDSEFITIPNPEEGEYRILVQGTGTGSYRIEASNIWSDESGKATESVATFRGDTTPSAMNSFSATLTDTDIRDSSALAIAGTSDPGDVPSVSVETSDGQSGKKKSNAKKSTKKTAVTVATASSDEVRPVSSGKLFPDPEAYPRASGILNKETRGIPPVVAGESDESSFPLSQRIALGVALISVIASGTWFGRRFIISKL